MVLVVTDQNIFFYHRYYLQNVLNVEQNPDPKKGNRFLLELQLGLHGSNESFRLSEYVYAPTGKNELCFPEGMVWQRNETIYFILPVKNQGKWVHHFTSQLANMSCQSGDFGFHVIIVDFESEDIDIDKAFSVWPLQERYTLTFLNVPCNPGDNEPIDGEMEMGKSAVGFRLVAETCPTNSS